MAVAGIIMFHMYDTWCFMADPRNLLPPTMKIFTTAEVAKLLRVSPPTVRSLKKRGELDAVAGLRTLRFSASTVAEFIDRKPRR